MLEYFLYRLAQGLVSVLPLGLSYWIAGRIADLHFFFSHKSRRQVFKNLHWIYDGRPLRDSSQKAREVFHHFAEYLVDFLRLSDMGEEEFLTRVHVTGLEYVQGGLKKGKGLIAVTAHFGNWEWGGVELSLLGYPVHALALAHRNRLVNQFFIQQRNQKGIHVVSKDRDIWKITEHLGKNELLVLVTDRDFSNNGIPVSFLGRNVYFPRGPAALSRRCGSPLVVGFVIRERKDTFHLVFEPPIAIEKTENLSEDLQQMTQTLALRFENTIRRYPTQWLLFEGLREVS